MMRLSESQIDALKELINIGVGRAAGVLSEMINCRIHLQVPSVKILTVEELSEEISAIGTGRVSAVKLGFRGSFGGSAALVFPPDSAAKLVSLLVSDDPSQPDLDSVRVGTLNEVGNIVINGVMGSISNILRQHIDYSLPSYLEENIEQMLHPDRHSADITILLAHTFFSVQEHMIEGNIVLIFESESFGALIAAVDREIA